MLGKPEIVIPIFVAMTMFFAQGAYAEGAPIIIDFDGVIRVITGSSATITSAVNDSAQNAVTSVNGTMNKLPKLLLELIVGATKSSLQSVNMTVLSAFGFFLEKNPDISMIKDSWNASVAAVSALYILFFSFAGAKFVLSANNLTERESAKEWLKNSFKMIICVMISFEIYKFVLELFGAITALFWNHAQNIFIDPSLFSGAGIIVLLIYLFSISIAAFLAFLRSLVLLVATPLIPFAIVLYFIPKMRNWGLLLFAIIFACLTMQIFDAVIFSAAAALAQSAVGISGYIFVFPMTFLAITIANIAILFFALIYAAFHPTIGIAK